MGPDQPVAVGFDGSEGSRTALRHAASIAEALGAELVLLQAVDSEQMIKAHADDHPISSGDARKVIDTQRAEAEARLVAEVTQLRKEGVTSARFEILEGRSGRAISRRAGELGCSLIAMGTQGHSGIVRAVLGSVADHVVHHAPCPVLLVGADDAGDAPSDQAESSQG